jgi:hypothetical protein
MAGGGSGANKKKKKGGWQNNMCKHYSTENHYRIKNFLNLLEYKKFPA